jgi:hypothetical protein
MAYDLVVMRTASPIQRLAAFLCLLLVLFLALTPSVASHAIAVLVLLLCVLPVAIFHTLPIVTTRVIQGKRPRYSHSHRALLLY